MNKFFRYCFIIMMMPCISRAQEFSFTDKEKGLQIIYSQDGPKLDSIAAHLLANDIKLVTGDQPAVITDIAKAKGNVIVIGNVAAPFIQQMIGKQSALAGALKGKWECFGLKVIDKPMNTISKAFVIAGSDARGTAYGVFSLSEKLGVSPWNWWADVPVKQQKALTIQQPEFISKTPSVKFRGIFINDEDWGLQPWAAKTFEPETGDIGPKTYAKVFELLLRLKANLIWPAMHPSTKAFFHYPQNKHVAEDYSIVIGTSHAEPMLRNNVDEWDEKTMGHFNYITNKEKVYNYWESRVKESTAIDALYTMGMRGVHDSGMEGVKGAKEAVPLLEQIIKDQRDLLTKYRGKKADSIPQVFTVYKEVLDIYDNGLKVPDDITLVWPDDNYGYIHRLNNEKEGMRSGGSGVYYHASYWGRPHDYLWLPSLHPSLICEEMGKAWLMGANRLWVLNVGDIKPLEFNIEFFLRMAYNVDGYLELDGVRTHLAYWCRRTFDKELDDPIANILMAYYQLAFERKPEFMGWSRTEPTTQTATTEYNHFYYGDEAQQRIDKYEALEKAVHALSAKLPGKNAAAFYQLVYYPVMCASWMNKKFLYRDKALFYAKQNRLSAKDYAARSKAMYDSIVKETDFYNNLLAGGKWKNMMSMKPRNLPVYEELVLPEITIDGSGGWGIAPEGFVTKDSSLLDTAGGMKLPAFDFIHQQQYFIDLFLTGREPVDWTAIPSHKWIRLSKSSGSLWEARDKNQERIIVDIDWNKVNKKGIINGTVRLKGGGRQFSINVQARQLDAPGVYHFNEFIENNGYVSMHAASTWQNVPKPPFEFTALNDAGYSGRILQVMPLSIKKIALSVDPDSIKKNNAFVEYNFHTVTAAKPAVTVFTLPTHPLNNNYSMRYGVSVDNGPVTVVDFKTVGRSEEWKRNVLSNRAARTVELPFLEKGRHSLKIYAIDPGVIFDEIRIDLGGLKKAYSILPQTIPHWMRGIRAY